MQIIPKHFHLLTATLLGYIALSPIVYLVVGNGLHLMLVWNLLLAFIPFVVVFIIDRRQINKPVPILILFGTWLLFFPNCFYIITDLIYLDKSDFMFQSNPYASIQYLQDISGYVALFHIFVGAILGVFYGIISLSFWFDFSRQWLKKEARIGILIGVSFLSSIGIYIGRFFRYNSWDLTQVGSIILDFIRSFSLFTLVFVFLFTLLHLLLFGLFHWHRIE